MTVINPIPIISGNQLLTAGPDTGQNDLVPALHLSRWATPGIKVVDIIGDSTGTELPANNYAYDPTQTIWGALKAEMMRRNPPKTFVFHNRAIGGANWAHPLQTANQTGTTQAPAWYTDRDKVWLDYVREDYPDTLFFVMGTNSPSSGQTAGPSVASYINDVFTYINGWMKVPDIILCTTKIGNPAAGPPYSTDQEAYKAMASFLRTFARSSANGYTAFPKIKYVGLIDLGRQYAARALGKDLALQYLSRVPSALHTGYTLVGPYPGTVTALGTTTDGDLCVTLVFRSAGGTAMYAALGATGFFIACTGFVANRIHVTLTGSGIWVVRYQLIGIDGAPVLTGTNYSPPSGDVTMTITLKGETIRILINDTYVIDTAVARLIQNCTVAIGAAATPSGSITFDVTEFLEGIGAPVLQTIDPTSAFGSPGQPTAGNDINHPASSTVALIDYQTIATANLAAPPPTAAQLKEDKVQLFVDMTSTPNTATTSEEILKSAPISGNQMLNIGDCLEIEAWGTMAGTTDNKSARVRWGGLTGSQVAAPFTTSATGARWRIIGTIMKSALNNQVISGQGIISNTNYATNSIAAALPDISPTTLVVTSQNSTTAAAASVTCDGFRVSYIRAPGT
jgi:hypothetical protein